MFAQVAKNREQGLKFLASWRTEQEFANVEASWTGGQILTSKRTFLFFVFLFFYCFVLILSDVSVFDVTPKTHNCADLLFILFFSFSFFDIHPKISSPLKVSQKETNIFLFSCLFSFSLSFTFFLLCIFFLHPFPPLSLHPPQIKIFTKKLKSKLNSAFGIFPEILFQIEQGF